MSEQEFSYFIDSSDIGSTPVSINVPVPADKAAILSKRLGLHSINSLSADLVLERNPVNKTICIKGIIHADIHQKCIVTTDPAHEIIEDEFEAWFSDPNSAVSFVKAKRERMSRKEKNDQPVMEETDDPEPIVDGKIDVGELIVQHLSLSLNPYPRLDGAQYKGKGDGALGEAPEGTYDNPFAALKDWKINEAKKEE